MEDGLTALRRLGRTHDALDHHGRDAREYGLGHPGRQYVGNRVRLWRLFLTLGVATAEDIPELPRLLRRKHSFRFATMSAMGQKQTSRHLGVMSVFTPNSGHSSVQMKCPLSAKSGHSGRAH